MRAWIGLCVERTYGTVYITKFVVLGIAKSHVVAIMRVSWSFSSSQGTLNTAG